MTKQENLLIINLAFIGDVLLATPTIRAIRAHYPHAAITLLTIPLVAEIAKLIPELDNVLICDKKGIHHGLCGMMKMARELKRHNFTHAFCMNFAPRGAMLAFLAGIPERIGYTAQHGGFFLTRTAIGIRGDNSRHESENQLDILKPANIPNPSDTHLRLAITSDLCNRFRHKQTQLKLPQNNYIIICPCGSYEQKNLSLEVAANIIADLTPFGTILLIGGHKEQAALTAIAEKANLPAENVLGGNLTLAELAVLISRAKLLISVDTGPLHIAQAVNCPTLGLYGHTAPAIWGPRNKNSRIIQKPLDSPCWAHITANSPAEILPVAAEIAHTAQELLQLEETLS